MLSDGGGVPLTALENVGQDRMGVARSQAEATDELEHDPLIDLRGPCGYLMARLDPVQATVEFKCRKCSEHQRRPVYHVFHLRIGRLMEAADRYGKDTVG